MYMYADTFPGDNKQDDSSNFGIYKQNWGMLRECASSAGFVGKSTAEWNDGALLKYVNRSTGQYIVTKGNDTNGDDSGDLYLDVVSRHECQGYYGFDIWFAGHRNGASGIADPNTPDIQRYRSAVEWIQERIDSDPVYLSDDTRFWVDVTPI